MRTPSKATYNTPNGLVTIIEGMDSILSIEMENRVLIVTYPNGAKKEIVSDYIKFENNAGKHNY